MEFQQGAREETVNRLMCSFTQDFVRQFEKKLIDFYQEMMGEIKESSGVPEIVVEGLGTALGALGGAVVGLPKLGAEMGAGLGRQAGEKAKEYAPDIGRHLGERAWLGWLGEKAGRKAGEYAPGLGEKTGEKIGSSVGEGVKNKVCDYINNIKDYLSGKERKSRVEKIVEMTAPLLLDSKLEFRIMLVDGAIDIFRSFESQFSRVTADSSSIMVVRKNIAVDTVERVIDYISNQSDPKMSSELVAKGIILGNSRGNALASFKFSQPGSSLTGEQSGRTWKTSELYETAGLVRKEGGRNRYYKKRGCNTDECGHRLLLSWEEKEWDDKLRDQYEVDASSPSRRYSYVLKMENLKQRSVDILKEIYDKDPVLQLTRKDLEDAAEEGAKRALGIQQSSKSSSCFVMEDPVWSFTGREKEIKMIRETMQLSAEKGTLLSRIIVISGLGGMGKSQLARMYAHKYRWDYDGNVIWINAEKFGDLERSFRMLAEKLKIPTTENEKKREIESIVKEVYEHFARGKSLFIFDNVEKYKSEMSNTDKNIDKCEQNIGWSSKLLFPISFLLSKGADKNYDVKEQDAGIDRFLPSSSLPDTRPYILITSRNRDWVSGLTVMELEGLESNDAVKLVKKALRILETEKSEDEEIEMLAKRVDNYPLALQQAAAYIHSQKTVIVRDYLKEYDKETGKLDNFQGTDNYAMPILTTWKVTIDKIAKDKEYGKLALDILNIIAYFPADNIKVEVFLNLAGRDGEKLSSAVELLLKYSMVNGKQCQTVLDIHRVVQRSTRIKLREEKREEEVLRESLGLFADNINEINVNYAVSVWRYASKSELFVREFSELPAKIILQLQEKIRYHEAHLFGREASELLKNILGPEHPDTLATQNKMAEVLNEKGKYGEALEVLQHVYDKRKKILGPECLDTLRTRYYMGVALWSQGKRGEALEALQYVFDKRNAVLGPDHPDTLMVQSKIGNILTHQGRYNEALEVYQVVHDKSESVMDSDLESMALIYFGQNKYDKALELLENALRQKGAILGPDHPQTLVIRNSIAATIYEQGNYSEALKIFNEVLDKRKVILGPDHPETLATWSLIIRALGSQGKYREALKLYEELLDKKNTILGSAHPSTLATRANMAYVLGKLGKYSEAICIYEEVYSISKRTDVLGPDHPDTLSAKHNIEILRKEQNSVCSIQLFREQQKAYLYLSCFVSHDLQNALIESVKPGLYLPSFKVRNVKINGKCSVVTRGLSQALLSLGSESCFLSNLGASAEIFERIAQGKQVSKREEREVFAFSKLMNAFEQQLDFSMNSLPSNLIYNEDYKTLGDLSNYISEIEGDFAIHLVTSNHVVAVYRTDDNYVYFDSNVALVSGLKSVDQLTKVIKKGVEYAGYEVGKKGFLVEHFNHERADKLLSSEDRQVLMREIKTERQLLARQDEELNLLKVNGQELSRVLLYDFGTKINVKDSVPLLINADMNLSSEKFQYKLDKKEVSMSAREYLDNLKIYENVKEVAQAIKVIPFMGSKQEIKKAGKTRNPFQKQLVHFMPTVSLSNLFNFNKRKAGN